MFRSLPTRKLTEHPDLDQLKRQAKELLESFRAGAPDSVAEVSAHYHDADPTTFALHDAHLVIARAYGFESWPRLKAYVEGATDQRLVAAVRAGDLPQVRALLQARPELSGRGGALHVAVATRAPALVRALMQHGANARTGVYPHRDATTALTMATERGYDEIAAIIREEEQRRRSATSASTSIDELFDAIRSGHDERAIALMESDPALIRARHPVFDATPLHVASHMLSDRLVSWLIDRGADVSDRAGRDQVTPLDATIQWLFHGERADRLDRFSSVTSHLLARGAAMTSRAAVALGDAEWLRAQHAVGLLTNPIEESGGLLTIAVRHDRPDILALLLDYGFDPDERTRFRDVGGDEVVFTWGMPLWHCAGTGKYEMAQMLLKRGADPNADVYASGTPVFQAYSQADWKMVELLARHGGVPDASTPGLYRHTELARRMLSGEAAYRIEGDGTQTLPEQLLWGAACGGDPEIVRMALVRVDWPRDDPRWFGILEQPLRIWRHGSIGANWDRRTYLTCFRLVLERCDPNIRGRVNDLGMTILHSVAGSREHVTADERVAFATMLLDAGARCDIRDQLLESTALGWACRWGRLELVALLLARGADPIEPEAKPWATPLAWARKKGHRQIEDALRAAGAR